MAKEFVLDDFNNQIITAKLLGDSAFIPTGSQDPKVWPTRTRFPFGEGYVKIKEGDECFRALNDTFQAQYLAINERAISIMGQGLSHGWISPEGSTKGRNFIFLVGELHEPKLMWRRMGAGTQVFNQIFFRNEKLSVRDFLKM